MPVILGFFLLMTVSHVSSVFNVPEADGVEPLSEVDYTIFPMDTSLGQREIKASVKLVIAVRLENYRVKPGFYYGNLNVVPMDPATKKAPQIIFNIKNRVLLKLYVPKRMRQFYWDKDQQVLRLDDSSGQFFYIFPASTSFRQFLIPADAKYAINLRHGSQFLIPADAKYAINLRQTTSHKSKSKRLKPPMPPKAIIDLVIETEWPEGKHIYRRGNWKGTDKVTRWGMPIECDVGIQAEGRFAESQVSSRLTHSAGSRTTSFHIRGAMVSGLGILYEDEKVHIPQCLRGELHLSMGGLGKLDTEYIMMTSSDAEANVNVDLQKLWSNCACTASYTGSSTAEAWVCKDISTRTFNQFLGWSVIPECVA